jgi:hypothetical protein
MKTFSVLSLISASASLASATIIWDGRFNNYSTAADLDKWSWNSQVGTYQTYIYGNLHVRCHYGGILSTLTLIGRGNRERKHHHGTRSLALTKTRRVRGEIHCIELVLTKGVRDSATAEKQGVKVKINASSIWNGGNMLRSELIPQSATSLSGNL